MRRVAVTVAVVVLENLNFNAAMKRDASRRDVVGPDEDAGISTWNHVTPFKFHYKVLIHAIGSNLPIGFPEQINMLS